MIKNDIKKYFENPIVRSAAPIVAVALVVGLFLVFSHSSISKHKEVAFKAGGVLTAKSTPAPEITGISQWINSKGETIKGLRGKVVLIDFWTYSCINCLRALPHNVGWYNKYKDSGFVELGIHSPEFAFEKVLGNVQKAVIENHITYPVGLDNELGTWNAFSNQSWPAEYLIDKDGNIRYTHFGEGEYSKTEQAIQALLKENGKTVHTAIDTSGDTAPIIASQTPETYLNYSRGGNFANSDKFVADKPVNYALSGQLLPSEWSLGGKWTVGKESSVTQENGAQLSINVSAKEVYLVMDGPNDQPITLTLNGQPVTPTNAGGSDVDANGQVHLRGARLYTLIKSDTALENATLTITLPSGVKTNAFTFGSQ
jgi:thiol-disulfide isomerase/thioredoxin